MDREAAIPEKNPAMERPEAQAAALVTRATTAFAAWKTLSLKERKARIGHLGRAIHHRRDDFSTLLREEVGKLEVEAYLADLLGLVDIVKYWTARIEAWLAPEPITFNPLNFPGKKALVTREPLGVLALITPWNYPLALTVRNLVPALLCGNCIIHKPSEHAPRVASLLQELCTEHLPEGVMQTLLGGPEAGRALVAAEVQGVSFIGSQAVGRSLAAALGPRLVPVSLELGGKDAALVLRDAPLERTVAGLVWGAFHNAGQDCSSIERAYLPAARREEFLTALRHASFNLVSIATSSGYASVDYAQWPIFAPLWMMFLTAIAASSGSTGGGIKMMRTLVLVKQAGREFLRLLHPAVVNPMKIGGHVVPNSIVFAVLGFIFLYFMTIVTLTFVLLISGMDFISAFTAVLASVNNCGPGLGTVGPASNYAGLTDFQTWVCAFGMLVGRLEIFTVLILFTPNFWRR